MKYTIVNSNGTMRVHKTGCKDLVKEINIVNSYWVDKAENTDELIHKAKQEFYEDAGGAGDYEKDLDINNEPRSFAEQHFEVLPCTKRI